MSTSVFPILMDVLETDIDEKILEVIDAIGFMVFYNHELADLNNATRIYEVMKKYKENQIIVWKCIICLSAFPLEESKLILTNIKNENKDNILGKEADRSLKYIKL